VLACPWRHPSYSENAITFRRPSSIDCSEKIFHQRLDICTVSHRRVTPQIIKCHTPINLGCVGSVMLLKIKESVKRLSNGTCRSTVYEWQTEPCKPPFTTSPPSTGERKSKTSEAADDPPGWRHNNATLTFADGRSCYFTPLVDDAW